MAESLILAHSQGRYLAEHFNRRDGIDVLYKPEAEIDELYDLIPTNIGDYKVIVLFAGINDIIHGWATSTVLRRFQRFYQHLQQKNPTAKIAIAGILPKRRNRWYAWSKEEEEQMKQENASAKIVNWRLSELSTAIRQG